MAGKIWPLYITLTESPTLLLTLFRLYVEPSARAQDNTLSNTMVKSELAGASHILLLAEAMQTV